MEAISNSVSLSSFLESRVVQFLKMTQFSYSLTFGIPLQSAKLVRGNITERVTDTRPPPPRACPALRCADGSDFSDHFCPNTECPHGASASNLIYAAAVSVSAPFISTPQPSCFGIFGTWMLSRYPLLGGEQQCEQVVSNKPLLTADYSSSGSHPPLALCC